MKKQNVLNITLSKKIKKKEMIQMPAIPTLETERLTLRAPGARDLGAFATFYASDASRFVGGNS